MEPTFDRVRLSPRQQEVARLLLQGLTNPEIATELNIQVRTVKAHMRSLFLRVTTKSPRTSRSQLAKMLIEAQKCDLVKL